MKAQHPDTAFQFKASPPKLDAKAAEPDAKLRKFSGVAYSGNPLPHPYWDQVAFDLSTTKAGDTTPILINHDRNQRAGFAKLAIDGSAISIADGQLMLDTEHGRAVATESDAGFPWQMSVHIEPGSIEQIKAGTEAEVNGQKITGPANIFRNNLIREVSFTPTGVDHNTSAAAMSAGGNQFTQPTGDSTMNLDELKGKVAELEAGLKASNEAKDAAEARATAAEASIETQRKDARMSAVKELFSATGRTYTEDAAKPYIGMDEATFSAVSADMKATKPTAPGHLFSDHATGGTDHQAGAGAGADKFSLNPADIYSARRK